MKYALAFVLAGIIAFQAHADTIELAAVDTGAYAFEPDNNPATQNGLHLAANLNYIVRGPISETDTTSSRNNNFFVFDLSGVTDAVIGATLKVENPSSNAAGQVYTVREVTTDIATLTATHADSLGNLAEGQAIFAELGSGTVYGSTPVSSVDITSEPPVVETVEFNAAGLAAINAATGLFAVGGSIDGKEAFASSFGFSVTLELKTGIVLSAVDTGAYAFEPDDNPPAQNGAHISANLNYIARGPISATDTTGSRNNNFFIFDLSPVTEGIVGATLRIENPSSNAAGQTYTIREVTTDIATLTATHADSLGNLAEGRAIYAELGSGTEYGSTVVSSVDITSEPPAVEEIVFNAAGLAALNSASGLFAVGGSIDGKQAFASSYGYAVSLVLQPGVVAVDTDADGIADTADNCPNDANPLQGDNDGDGIGDVCDPDDDNDTVPDLEDNCPLVANTLQTDDDFDGLGNPCDGTFDAGSAAQHVDDLVSLSVVEISIANPPGGNGLIAKLTGNGGVIQTLGNAVSAFAAGAIDAATYVSELEATLNKLGAFENQLNAKIGNGAITDPEASNLLSDVAGMRATIESLIAAAGP